MVGIIDYQATTPAEFFDFVDPDLDPPTDPSPAAPPSTSPVVPSKPVPNPIRTTPPSSSAVLGKAVDRIGPSVSFSTKALGLQKLKTVLSKGLKVRLAVSEAGTFKVTLHPDAGTAKQLKLSTRTTFAAGTSVATKKARLT